MRLGVVLEGGTGGSAADLYDRLIEQGRFAEEQGLESAWIIERHFSKSCPAASAVVLAAALAAVTRGLRIGVLLPLPLEHPVTLAEHGAVLDRLSGGRLLFGAGLGSDADAFRGAPHPGSQRREAFREALDIIVNAWTRDGFAYHGRFHRLPLHTRTEAAGGVLQPEPLDPPFLLPWRRAGLPFDYLSVLPKPTQIPHPPVYLDADEDGVASLAARRGFSVLLSEGEAGGALGRRADDYWQALVDAGRELHEVVLAVVRDVHVEVHGETARARVPGAATGALVGSPDEVVREVKALQRRTNASQLLCRVGLPGLAEERIAESLFLLASEVRPRLDM